MGVALKKLQSMGVAVKKNPPIEGLDFLRVPPNNGSGFEKTPIDGRCFKKHRQSRGVISERCLLLMGVTLKKLLLVGGATKASSIKGHVGKENTYC